MIIEQKKDWIWKIVWEDRFSGGPIWGVVLYFIKFCGRYIRWYLGVIWWLMIFQHDSKEWSMTLEVDQTIYTIVLNGNKSLKTAKMYILPFSPHRNSRYTLFYDPANFGCTLKRKVELFRQWLAYKMIKRSPSYIWWWNIFKLMS